MSANKLSFDDTRKGHSPTMDNLQAIAYNFLNEHLHQSHTQMSAKTGIKKHGERAIEALLKELAQLEDMNTFEPQHAQKLTREQRSEALRIINLIKEKRDDSLKGRTCVDGRPQRQYISKEEAASPTVSTEALLCTLVVDAHENRYVATADIKGAYLHTEMDDYVLVKLDGEVVDVFCELNPRYKDFVVMEGNKKVLYMRLIKALYGCVKSALLWYELYTETLKEMGFELNPYDLCVANKKINGEQCTIVWHVDDNKISHVEADVVEDVISMIESKFGKMKITCGNTHVFLGMTIHFPGDGTVHVDTIAHIREAIEDFGEPIDRSAATPALRSLFDVSGPAEELTPVQQQKFKSIVPKLIWITKGGRPDIKLAVSFLWTRVSKWNGSDWKKLRRVLRYLYGTINDVRILSMENMDTIFTSFTFVDVAYAVHYDMRCLSGGGLSLGCGLIHAKSSKQKLNTKSSTESEVVGASDYLPYLIWMQNFMAAQGFEFKRNIFYQDNQSAMRLERNGRQSCGQKSRHIDIRYFFIKDRIKSGNIDLQYFPTEVMLADFFTKPLQGKQFKLLRSAVMGWITLDELKSSLIVKSKGAC
mmetsp:Transcript_26617/g.41320  ORF Transcript_26617/g.41320 Transcript_26617/m.41320 type:complete len:590 (+) Transcript_26617:1688-3457(+)